MIILLDSKATQEQKIQVTQFYEGYAKVVVDIKNKLLAAGGEYHIDCEQPLIENGSEQNSLWGGGYRINTKEVDFMAMTNYKPHLSHYSYEITFPEIRQEVESIIREIFENE